MQGLVQFQEQTGIKLGLLVIALDLKYEGLPDVEIAIGLHLLCSIATLEEANSYRDLFVVAGAYVVNESGSVHHVNGQVAFIFIQAIQSLGQRLAPPALRGLAHRFPLAETVGLRNFNILTELFLCFLLDREGFD